MLVAILFSSFVSIPQTPVLLQENQGIVRSEEQPVLLEIKAVINDSGTTWVYEVHHPLLGPIHVDGPADLETGDYILVNV